MMNYTSSLLTSKPTLNPRKRLEIAAKAALELDARRLRELHRQRGGLHHFIKHFWHVLEPGRRFIDGWPLWAMCQHLEAVTRGEIPRLLMNVPPGSMKSLLCNVFWPAWVWGPMDMPHTRFLSFSYAAYLTERDNQKLSMIVASDEYQRLYSDRFDLIEDGKRKISTDGTGWKFATSVGGVGTGERGDIIILDDPHNIKDGESEKIREETVRWFKEAMLNRLNDMVNSKIVVIMQRVHQDDVSGAIIDDPDDLDDWEHLMIPMLYEPDRHCETSIWEDPRTEEGECYWPERFPPLAVRRCQAQGPFAWSAQYQQIPKPRGTTIFEARYWRRWESENGKFPKLQYVVASLDPAFTEKTHNDPAGFTMWGAFTTEDGTASAMMLTAWREWLKLHGPEAERLEGETRAEYKRRCGEDWGLVEHVAHSCERFGADILLIEAKASGHCVAQEMLRLITKKGLSLKVQLVDPGALDKVARAMRVQPIFSADQIWAPERTWADMVKDEMEYFPKSKYDDLTDSATQALWWMRCAGFLTRREERRADEEDAMKVPTKAAAPLYPA